MNWNYAMHRVMKKNINQLGFTLVEMAIVLVIVGLLISGLLIPLGVQRDLRDYGEARAELAELREALIGFAMSNSASDGRPYLPCPDTNGNGDENREVAGGCTDAAGEVPWVLLGLGLSDSWNNAYLYRVTAAYSNSNVGFTLIPLGGNDIVNTAGGANVATGIPAVIVSKGKNGNGASVDELENSDGDATFVSKEQIDLAANAFDDVVVWVPTTILVNRMVTAGRLP